MKLKQLLSNSNGLRFMVEDLKIQSSAAAGYLLDVDYLTSAADIQRELDRVEQTITEIIQNADAKLAVRLRVAVAHVKDIRTTLSNLANKQTLTDIEFFEVKGLCMLSEEARSLLAAGGSALVSLPDLSAVLQLLDPEQAKVHTFYIYNSYSKTLYSLRQQVKEIQQKIESLAEDSEERMREEEALDALRLACEEEEENVRKQLSSRLVEYADRLGSALQQLMELDILMAKAEQALRWQLCKPTLAAANNEVALQAVFNPQLQQLLQEEGKTYQPVGIALKGGTCLVTGANMAGKTVLLKTLAMVQYLFQFGFYLPATQAAMSSVNEVLLCIGDGQNELNGLSSFASEILSINTIIEKVQTGMPYLVLIDEPARTTNPTEGRALVDAMIDSLNMPSANSVITTHYDCRSTACRRLRVKGFVGTEDVSITPANINRYVDYSLLEDNATEVPHEALRIASILGVSSKLIQQAENYLGA